MLEKAPKSFIHSEVKFNDHEKYRGTKLDRLFSNFFKKNSKEYFFKFEKKKF